MEREVEKSEMPPMADLPRAERSLPRSLVGVTRREGLGERSERRERSERGSAKEREGARCSERGEM
jgi:hypothetical protein